MTIGALSRIPLREVWKHEAADFTTWLEQNVDILNEVLDITIVNAERERSAGAFRVDLVAEDEHGNTVVIENQLEKSDHDHLGKVIMVRQHGTQVELYFNTGDPDINLALSNSSGHSRRPLTKPLEVPWNGNPWRASRPAGSVLAWSWAAGETRRNGRRSPRRPSTPWFACTAR